MSDGPTAFPIVHQVDVLESPSNSRLDKFLATILPELSRSRLKSLILEGHVHSQKGKITNVSHKVSLGDTYFIEIPPPECASPLPQALPLNIVYEDQHLLVLDKPVNFVVHPGAGRINNTLVNALLAHCGDSLSGIGGVRRPGIVHRLDKDTSGLMVVAKDDQTHKGLATQFEQRTIKRAYIAAVWGAPRPSEGEVEAPLGRSSRNRQKMAINFRHGKRALTHYKTLRSYGEGKASLVECRLSTGRTHQIRVHMTSIGHPLIGDPLYGRPFPFINWSKDRQALHAYCLGFAHPVDGRWLEFSSDYPDDIQDLILQLEKM